MTPEKEQELAARVLRTMVDDIRAGSRDSAEWFIDWVSEAEGGLTTVREKFAAIGEDADELLTLSRKLAAH